MPYQGFDSGADLHDFAVFGGHRRVSAMEGGRRTGLRRGATVLRGPTATDQINGGQGVVNGQETSPTWKFSGPFWRQFKAC